MEMTVRQCVLLPHALVLSSDMHCFDDEDELEYLTSLMSDDDNEEAEEEVSLRCSTKDEKLKGRTESGVFDEELDTVAKDRKRRFSQETQARTRAHIKKRRKEQSGQENDNRTALLEGE